MCVLKFSWTICNNAFKVMFFTIIIATLRCEIFLIIISEMITQIINNNSRRMYDTAVVLVNVIVKLRVDLDYKCLSKCTLDVCLKLPKLSYLTDANACGWKRVTPVGAWWLLRTSGGGLSNIYRPRMETRQEVCLWLDIIRKLFVGKIQFWNETVFNEMCVSKSFFMYMVK